MIGVLIEEGFHIHQCATIIGLDRLVVALETQLGLGLLLQAREGREVWVVALRAPALGGHRGMGHQSGFYRLREPIVTLDTEFGNGALELEWGVGGVRVMACDASVLHRFVEVACLSGRGLELLVAVETNPARTILEQRFERA